MKKVINPKLIATVIQKSNAVSVSRASVLPHGFGSLLERISANKANFNSNLALRSYSSTSFSSFNPQPSKLFKRNFASLIKIKDINDQLWNSVCLNDVEGVKKAVVNGADVNAFFLLNDERMAALHWAARYACRTGSLDLVRFLLDRKANVNLKVEDGWTPLHESVDEGGADVTRFLIQNKANVDERNAEGETPLHMAVLAKNEKLVELLLNSKASLEIKDNDGLTPLHVAADEGSVEITAMLLENGANPDAVDNNGLTPAQLAMSAGNNKVARQIRRHVIQSRLNKIQSDVKQLQQLLKEDEENDTELRYLTNKQ